MIENTANNGKAWAFFPFWESFVPNSEILIRSVFCYRYGMFRGNCLDSKLSEEPQVRKNILGIVLLAATFMFASSSFDNYRPKSGVETADLPPPYPWPTAPGVLPAVV
jgi:hypothetical protein